jgi:hypothetical protein
MVTSVILGLGIVGLTSMYTTSARGVGSSRALETATQIALSRVERLATTPTDQLPVCGGVVGCRASPTEMAQELAPSAGSFQCSQYVDDSGAHDGATRGSEGGYRLDTIVAPHPSVTQNSDARIVSVSVCWTDGSGRVQQVLMQRLALGDE